MKLWVLLSLGLLAAASTGAGFRAQQQSTMSAESRTTASKSIGDIAPLDVAGVSSIPKAAIENKRKSAELEWLFGGKSQRGWAIYLPLICNQVQGDMDIGSADFAQAVLRWQKARGVPQTGVLDDETWSSMVADFQSRRIKERHPPSPNDLVVAPASEFFDPERPAELRQVERAAYDAYKRMVAEAVKESSLGLRSNPDGGLDSSEKYLKIISSFRSREYQENLRRASPRSGRAGLAINSPHFTGRALDLYVGGEPVNTSDANRLVQTRTPVYRWLVKNAARFGFRPYFYEPWHWEYVP